MKRLHGKIVLITGAASGIGKASARLFAAEGATLGLMDIKEEEGQAVVKAILTDGGSAKFIRTDVTDRAQISNAIEIFVDEFGDPHKLRL